METTDLLTSIGVDSINQKVNPDKAVGRADKVLRAKGRSSKGLKQDLPIDSNLLLGKPELKELTGSDLKKIYPIKVNDAALDNVARVINTATEDMDFAIAKEFRDNCISYIDSITIGQRSVPIEDYVSAVKFVTFKMAGNTDVRAYALTFPDRIRRMEEEKLPNSHLYTYASIYTRGKVVVDLLSKMIVPTHILFQDIFHKAVKTQAEIMMDTSVSPKVRSDAANSLMTHLKTPEIKQMEVKVETSSISAIDQLSEALNALSGKQKEMLSSGSYTMKDLREATIIEVENNDSN